MADDSPAGTFDNDGATDFQVQCAQNIRFDSSFFV